MESINFKINGLEQDDQRLSAAEREGLAMANDLMAEAVAWVQAGQTERAVAKVKKAGEIMAELIK